ncbi:phosphonoacetaldehyde hydrolase [Rhodobium gokarnense]|uniref:Phosphonoacetaldehyde hydrolase n=1 Tax=Rhodobium gokarnense TaxID=364296 RepID=A0ABT3H8Z2_9HYPH|nr:phosphonoacetaldehyde hydrolase [Rhodobium gokarnense]MCW2306861.1 phosphonoacetaldehyde hydrolase [Rhodobium gokarnense]
MTYEHLKAAVFDWAGTMVDFGSTAPMGAFVDVFSEFGVPISIADARKPMGLPKLDHIRALGAMPHVSDAWRAAHGGAPFDEAAANEVYRLYVPRVSAVVPDYADLIPGAAETVAALRAGGLKIGSTTGYTRSVMEGVLPRAASQGYAPDNLVCADDVPEGRPTPLMMYRCFLDLCVWPASAVVKVDDTAPGIAEGRAAGSWTVGVALSGNEAGLSLEEYGALGDADRRALREKAGSVLADADYVIDTVADLLPVMDEIDRRLAAGERPRTD